MNELENEKKKLYADNVRMNVIACAYIREAAKLLSFSIPEVSQALYAIAIGLLEKVNPEEIEKVEEVKEFISKIDPKNNSNSDTGNSCGV